MFGILGLLHQVQLESIIGSRDIALSRSMYWAPTCLKVRGKELRAFYLMHCVNIGQYLIRMSVLCKQI